MYNIGVFKSNFCDYNVTYILVRGDTTITEQAATQVAFKHCTPPTERTTKIHETTVDDAEDLHLVMLI